MQELNKSNKLFFRRYEKEEVYNIESYQTTELFNIFTCKIKIKIKNDTNDNHNIISLNNKDVEKKADVNNESQIEKIVNKDLNQIEDKSQSEKEIKLFLIYYKKLSFSPKLIEDVFEKSYFLKLKSEFILEKIGYVINFEAHTIGFLYEYFEGKILSFNDISNISIINKEKKLSLIGVKLNFLTRILHIVKKLLNIEVSIGYINPNNFICNMESGGIIKMIEPFILNFCAINDIYTSCIFGFFKDDYTIPNDKLMLVIFLIYSICYDENKKQISYQNFLLNFYKYINSKNYESPIDKFIQENSNEEFYKLISKHISLSSIELDLNNNDLLGNKSKYFSQVNRINNLNDEIIAFLSGIIFKEKCFECSEMSNNIHPVSNIYLCNAHINTYSDKNTSLNTILKLKEKIEIQRHEYKDIELDKKTTQDFTKINLKDEHIKKFVEKSEEYLQKDEHIKFQIYQGQSVVNDIFSYHRSNIKRFLTYEFNNYLSQLENYKNNLVSEEIMDRNIYKIEQYVLIAKNFIEEMNSENSFYNSLQNLRMNNENYNYELSFLKKQLIDVLFDNFNFDINRIFNDKIISSKFMKKYNIPLIIENNQNGFEFISFIMFKNKNIVDIVTNKVISEIKTSNSIKNTGEDSLFKIAIDSKIDEEKSLLEIFRSYVQTISNDIIKYENIFTHENFIEKLIFNINDLEGTLNNEQLEIKEILNNRSRIVYDISNENLMMILHESNGAYLFDINLKKTFRLENMKFNHKFPTCCYSNYNVFVIGGNTKKCECFNLLLNSWKELPDIPFIIKDSVSFFDFKNNLYIVGGEILVEDDINNEDFKKGNVNENNIENKSFDDSQIQKEVKYRKNTMLKLNLNCSTSQWEIIKFNTELHEKETNFFNASKFGIINNFVSSQISGEKE